MVRFAWSQLRGRAGRTLAVLLGVLVSTTGFTVLTGATDTAQLLVRDTVDQNARGAYDILIRPAGSRSAAEQQGDRVRPNFLSDVYGGITPDEWARVRQLPGVEIAAPVAMLGFVAWETTLPLDLTAALDTTKTRQVILLRPTSHADRGLTAAADKPGWVYVTRRPIVWPTAPPGDRWDKWNGEYADGVRRDPTVTAQLCSEGLPAEAPYEIQEDGREVPICATGSHYVGQFDGDYQYRRIPHYVAQLRADGRFAVRDLDGYQSPVSTEDTPRASLRISVPIRIPLARGRDRPGTGGRADRPGPDGHRGPLPQRHRPAGRRADRGPEHAGLPLPGGPGPGAGDRGRPTVSGRTAHHRRGPPRRPGRGRAERRAAVGDRGPTRRPDRVHGQLRRRRLLCGQWWPDPGAVPPLRRPADRRHRYTPDGAGALRVSPRPPASRLEGWGAAYPAPLLADDVALRPMLPGINSLQLGVQAQSVYGQSVGVFDPSRVTGGGSNIAAPVELYRRPVATGADDRTSALLDGQELLPSTNPGAT